MFFTRKGTVFTLVIDVFYHVFFAVIHLDNSCQLIHGLIDARHSCGWCVAFTTAMKDYLVICFMNVFEHVHTKCFVTHTVSQYIALTTAMNVSSACIYF